MRARVVIGGHDSFQRAKMSGAAGRGVIVSPAVLTRQAMAWTISSVLHRKNDISPPISIAQYYKPTTVIICKRK